MKSKFLPIFLIMVVCSTIVRAQIITTIAGTPTVSGFSGDGGPAVSAKLGSIGNIAIDRNGLVYLADEWNSRIRKIDSLGIINTVAGNGYSGHSGDGGPATAAMIGYSNNVLTDGNGYVYINDANNGYIRKIDASGVINSIAGNGSLGYSGDGGPATAAQIDPFVIAMDKIGNIYFTSHSYNCVRKIDTAGVITTIAGTGVAGFSGDGGPATAAQIYGYYGLVIDLLGNIYISDVVNLRIRKINPAGIISTVAGTGASGTSGDGGPATAAKLYSPSGLTISKAGDLYMVDNNTHRIRKIDRYGIITTVAGTSGSGGFSGDGGPATAAQLKYPWAVTTDSLGNLYIDDFGNYCIRFVQFNKPPVFGGGRMQTLPVCRNITASVNTLLTATDIDSTQRLNWSTVLAPMHGTLVAAYSAVSLGLPLTPTGLYYSPSTGYTGPDTFKVRVTDGQFADTTTVYVNVTAVLPVATAIMGGDSLCIADTLQLSDTSTGGIWHSSNTAIATVGASTGIVTGVGTGRDTIYYVVSNVCGTDTAFLPVYVMPHAYCHVSIPENTSTGKVSIYPNPNTNVLHIESPIAVKTVISNMEGKVVLEYNGVKDCDISSLPAGVYVTSLYDESGTRLLVQKIVKE